MTRWIYKHLPCPMCDSSDGYSLDEDGFGWCFSCSNEDNQGKPYDENKDDSVTASAVKKDVYVPPSLPKGVYCSIPDRKLTEKTCKKFDITCAIKDGVIVSHAYGYYDSERKRSVVKQRKCDPKSFVTHDGRTVDSTGERVNKTGLFGWQVFPAGGKTVTITEGEVDAASVFEMNGGWPVTSVRSSSTAVGDCKAFHTYLNSFGKVYIAFDNDKAGKKAAETVAKLFPGKAYIMTMTQYNDPNEYLVAGKGKEFIREWYNSVLAKLDGICYGVEQWTKLATAKPKKGTPLIWKGLNDATYGIRLGEVWTFGGGTGLGKSECLKELAYGLVKDQGKKCGMIFLEEGHDRTGQCLISKDLGYRFFLEDEQTPSAEELEPAIALMADNIALSYGIDQTWDKVEQQIMTMKHGLGIEYIFLDHVTAIAEGKGQDVNAALHAIYEKLNTIANQEQIAIFCISHLNQSANKNHEEGARVTLRDFYGSGAIKMRSDFVFGIEGDTQGIDIKDNYRNLRILKDRPRGDSAGTVVCLKYHTHARGDDLDGRLLETDRDYEEIGDD